VISTDPKISIIPGFLLPDECDHIVNLAESKGFSRSLVGRGKYSIGEDKSEGLSNVYSDNRTSTSVNLDQGHDEILSVIEHRLSGLVKIPLEFLESLVVVKYEPGQYFGPHHDGLFRPYTVFIYLNDVDPTGGGETRFTNLALSIKPHKGAAVVWRNTKTVDCAEGGSKEVEDDRVVHEALPPLDGKIKYGVNCFFNECVMRN
jgi:prolyl 4-hydroxylase